MDVDDFIPQYEHSINKDAEEKLYQLYVNIFPDFDSKTYMDFETFLKQMTGKPQTNTTHDKKPKKLSVKMTDEERIKDAEKIMKMVSIN